MIRANVKSGNVRSVGYDPGSKTLEVEYRNGGVYQYVNVPAETHKALMEADSIGGHLSVYVKGQYDHVKLEPQDAPTE